MMIATVYSETDQTLDQHAARAFFGEPSTPVHGKNDTHGSICILALPLDVQNSIDSYRSYTMNMIFGCASADDPQLRAKAREVLARRKINGIGNWKETFASDVSKLTD